MSRGRLVRATRYQVNISLFLIWSVADTGLAQYTQHVCLYQNATFISFTFLICYYLLSGIVFTCSAEVYQLLSTLVTNLMVVIRWSLQHSNSTEI